MNARPKALALAAWICGCESASDPQAAPGSHLRIVSQTVLADEVLWRLGESVRSRVVAVSKMADDRLYSPVVGVWPETIPRISGESERLLALQPDLAILAGFTSVETRAVLSRAGVTQVVIDRYDGFEGYRANVRGIAQAIPAEEEGERLIREFDLRLKEWTRAPADPLPLALSWDEGQTAGFGTTFHDIALAAGLGNLAAVRGIRGHATVSLEELVAWDPEVLVVPCDEDCANVEQDIARRAGIRATRAARFARVVALPRPLLYATGPSMLDALQLLSARVGAPP